MSRPSALVLALALVGSLLAPTAAFADHGDPSSATLVGDLQSELGCDGDWLPDCSATSLVDADGDGAWTGTFEVPAGEWEYKVALDGGWDGSVGAGGAVDGPNIGLSLAADSTVTFSYDHASHEITAEGADGGGDDEGLEPGDLDLLRPSLREDLTDEVFYFVLPDRFFNGDESNDTGGFGDTLEQHSFDPTDEGFFHGGTSPACSRRSTTSSSSGSPRYGWRPSSRTSPRRALAPTTSQPGTTATEPWTTRRSIRTSARTKSSHD